MKVLLVISFMVLEGYGAIFQTETEMHKHLLEGYDQHVRPVKNASRPIDMKIKLFINQILGLDEKNQIMSSQVSFLQSWTDEHLHWNSTEYDAQPFLNIPKNDLWGMDLYIKNSVGNTVDSMKAFHRLLSTYIMVAEGGECISYSPFVLETSCDMDIHMFPFDSQTCNIQAGSWMYISDQLNLTIMDPAISLAVNHSGDFGDWVVTDMDAWNDQVPYEIMVGGKWKVIYYDEVTFSITLKRNPMFYIYNIVIPTAIVGFLSIFSFLIPPESGDRTSLCLTTLLAIAVYAMVASDNVPESSREIPTLICLLFLYMGITGACTIWAVIVTRVTAMSSRYKNPPSKYVILGVFSRCGSCRKSKTQNGDPKSGMKLVEIDQENNALDSSNDGNKSDHSEEWKEFLNILDKCFFVMFMVVYMVLTITFLV